MDFSFFQNPDFVGLFVKILIASLLISIACSYIGVFLILRKMIFFGIGLTQASTLGLSIASVMGVSSYVMEGSAIFLTIILFSLFASNEISSKESLIAIIYCVATGIAILLVANSPHGDSHILYSIKGNVLGIQNTQLHWLTGLIGVIGVIHFLFYKQFLITTYDPVFSRTLRIKVKLWDVLLYSTVGILIAYVTKLSGSLMVFTLLILPGILAIKMFNQLKHTYIFAVVLSIISCILGVGVSLILDLPTGPGIVVMTFILMLVTWVIFNIFKVARSH